MYLSLLAFGLFVAFMFFKRTSKGERPGYESGRNDDALQDASYDPYQDDSSADLDQGNADPYHDDLMFDKD